MVQSYMHRGAVGGRPHAGKGKDESSGPLQELVAIGITVLLGHFPGREAGDIAA